ncbi:MAG: glycosyltransferase, partial [Cohaesibacter sp.]|nr:glycosyltransferase [Cohaesibacter sp.]
VTDQQTEALRKTWGLDERPILLLPSRLTRWKGQSFILPILGALAKQGLAFQMAMIGDDQGRQAYVEELDSLIKEHDLQDRVKRVGHCADMPAAYTLADLVLVPSQEAETFGRSAAESLAMQTPVLVGDLGAQPEVVAAPNSNSNADAAPDWPGQSLAHQDRKAWQDAIAHHLSKGSDKTGTAAKAARQHVQQSFSLQSMGQQTLCVYNSLLPQDRQFPVS